MEDIRRRQFSGQRPLVLDVNMDSLAYIVYTSGTTGKPKGTMTHPFHACLCNPRLLFTLISTSMCFAI